MLKIVFEGKHRCTPLHCFLQPFYSQAKGIRMEDEDLEQEDLEQEDLEQFVRQFT